MAESALVWVVRVRAVSRSAQRDANEAKRRKDQEELDKRKAKLEKKKRA